MFTSPKHPDELIPYVTRFGMKVAAIVHGGDYVQAAATRPDYKGFADAGSQIDSRAASQTGDELLEGDGWQTAHHGRRKGGGRGRQEKDLQSSTATLLRNSMGDVITRHDGEGVVGGGRFALLGSDSDEDEPNIDVAMTADMETGA